MDHPSHQASMIAISFVLLLSIISTSVVTGFVVVGLSSSSSSSSSVIDFNNNNNNSNMISIRNIIRRSSSSTTSSPSVGSALSSYLDSLNENETVTEPQAAPPSITFAASPYIAAAAASAPTPTITSSSSRTFSSFSSSSSAATPTPSNFDYVPVLSLDHADCIATKVVECCERNGFNPVTVTVLDAAGSTICMKRMDGCSPVGSPEMSRAKAYGCIVNKYPSRMFRDRYTADDASAKFCQMTTMVAISGNQMAPFPGGIVLKLNDYLIGAVGVSGAAGDEDEYCAIQAVYEANLGLTTIPHTHSCGTVQD